MTLFDNIETGFCLESTGNIHSSEKIGNPSLVRKNKRKMMSVQREECLSELLPEINKGESLHILSNENFGSIEMLSVLLSRYDVKDIKITTWSFNEEFVELITKALQKGVSIQFCCDKSIKGRKAHLYAQVARLRIEHRNLFNLILHDGVHAKVTILDSGEDKLVVECSANYSKNVKIEQFCITNDVELYNFHNEWQKKIKTM